jgi:radical SAM protein (TIGR01212 family)
LKNNNPFKYSFDNKRYHTWNYHLREQFGEKVMKISLDGGFTCPNRDGFVTYGGCTFCSSSGSGDYAGNRAEPLSEQFEKIKIRMHDKWKSGKYIAYFQAFTNTYAPVSVLKEKFEEAISYENVVGISIGTRPDCLPDDVIEYLAELNKRTYLWIEMGLQTIHDTTAKLINRAYNYETYKKAVEKLRKHNIRVCCHIIDGLPLENEEMMLETVREISQLDIQGVKIHLLHLLKDTPMVKQYERGDLKLMEKDDYVRLVVKQLELIPPEIIIHRLTGDGPRDLMIGPMWSLKKWEVLNAIDAELLAQDTWQGKKFVRNN